jgi:hypothetical protein
MILDQSSRLQQFYLRSLLVAGMLWGGMPFVTGPLVAQGSGQSHFAIAAALFSSFTILPACALAFWHRRSACVWLTLNAAAIIAVWLDSLRSGHVINFTESVGILGSVALALTLDFMELRHWPGALEK